MYSVASLRENRLMYRTSEEMRAINVLMKNDSATMAKDSKTMTKDSGTMAAIALLGAVFLPTSMVATIMGAVFDGQENTGSAGKVLGVLFGVSVPITISLIILLYKNLPIRRNWRSR
jgi:hypothetical protein